MFSLAERLEMLKTLTAHPEKCAHPKAFHGLMVGVCEIDRRNLRVARDSSRERLRI